MNWGELPVMRCVCLEIVGMNCVFGKLRDEKDDECFGNKKGICYLWSLILGCFIISDLYNIQRLRIK